MGLKRQDNSKILCWLILFGTMPKTLWRICNHFT
jgi:hypothetical protein